MIPLLEHSLLATLLPLFFPYVILFPPLSPSGIHIDSTISRPGLTHYGKYFPCCYMLFISVIPGSKLTGPTPDGWTFRLFQIFHRYT